VVDTANDRFHARVVTKDTANDLALVKADHHWPQPASFRDSNVLRLGESAAVSGFPLAGLVASSMAMTVGTVSATAGPRDDSRFFQVSAPVQPGNSGGPVLDNQGHVIGMVTSQLNGVLLPIVAGIAPQNVNFAIKGAIIGNFLESQGVDFARIGNAPELSTTDMGVLARRFTVRIECGTIAR
jgi:S1-C subfamily serine protease